MDNGYLFDGIYANLSLLRPRVKFLLKPVMPFHYRKFAKNWIQISFYRLLRKYPFEIKTYQGQGIKIQNEKAWRKEIGKLNKDLIRDKYGIKFLGIERGDARAILNEDYKFLVDPGNYVVDIGANVGDTALYFWHYGMKVLGFEPYPVLYNTALKNVHINKIESITIKRAALGKKDEYIYLENVKDADLGISIKFYKKGIKTPVYSLKTAIHKFAVPRDANLKIDCEGCEYDIILNSDDKTLKHFKKIQIEYHYGRKNLVERLKKAGFNVRSTLPRKGWNTWANKYMYVGYIYAERN